MTKSLKNDFIDQEPIMDSIYGMIKLSLFEKRILSSKEMQRLRGIKQLGFVNLVYPDAEHSRFAHSIGVCHQAKTLVDQTSNNINNSQQYQKWRSKFLKNVNETDRIYGITLVERIVISLAALLHDLPHSPFSHEIEVSTSKEKGIPVHDNFESNFVFFSYLFEKEKSDLAKLLNIYNQSFWELLIEDKKWGERIKKVSAIKDGYVVVHENRNIDSIVIDEGETRSKYLKLPVLGVMIFEILLFDKVENWLDIDTLSQNDNGVKIKIDYSGNSLLWKPIWAWFRPYRKDIIANTICADLLDYLIRDGKNTGILSSLDLKFFDRTTIAKAIPDRTETLIPLSQLPDFCEHIVFDVFDHKRGVIRQSIITEIIAFLQQRYLLAERVYNHRIVEGARSMLQEVSRLLILTNSVNINDLHDTNTPNDSPINDDAFFSWVLRIEANENKQVIKAKKLVKMLQERRIFREAVIIDGTIDSHKGSFRGNDVNCRTLADALLNDEKRNKIIDDLETELYSYLSKKSFDIPDFKNEPIFTVGVRKYGKRYKIPRVLVARPLNIEQDNDIEVFPLFDGKKLPSISNRLESMQHAYNSLWQVILFIHPFFHQRKFVELHTKISESFLKNLYKETNITWGNSIGNYNNLLPEDSLDIDTFVREFSLQDPQDEKQFLSALIVIINDSIPSGGEKFKLNPSSSKSLGQKLRKIQNGKEIFMSFSTQEKILKELELFKPNIGEAAKDNEELVINQVVTTIQNIITNNGLF